MNAKELEEMLQMQTKLVTHYTLENSKLQELVDYYKEDKLESLEFLDAKNSEIKNLNQKLSDEKKLNKKLQELVDYYKEDNLELLELLDAKKSDYNFIFDDLGHFIRRYEYEVKKNKELQAQLDEIDNTFKRIIDLIDPSNWIEDKEEPVEGCMADFDKEPEIPSYKREYIHLGHLKKGDHFFEGCVELIALEDAYCSGSVNIMDELYQQWSCKAMRLDDGKVIDFLSTKGHEGYGSMLYKLKKNK